MLLLLRAVGLAASHNWLGDLQELLDICASPR